MRRGRDAYAIQEVMDESHLAEVGYIRAQAAC